jgi:DNA topoisomerase-1
LVFPGFIAVYKEDLDDSIEEGEERLPQLEEGQSIPVDRVFGEQHFTQPPPRYTEASLVKTLEEYGIGRPSTYASIISTLQDRGYAYLDKKRFMPTDLGRLVSGFLSAHFNPYIDYDFTARMEDQLDFISDGKREWVPVLKEFWEAFSATLEEKQDVARGSPLGETCPKCKKGELYLQNSRRGLFVGCSRYPECDYTRPWGALADGPMNLGKDPDSDLDVLLMRGPYGYYVQLGPTDPKAKSKPKRAAWPKKAPIATADLEIALKLLALPRQLGQHPQTGLPILANIGPFGPYVKHDGAYKSIPKSDSVYDITLARAVELLSQPKSARGPAGKNLGPHPQDQQAVALLSGRYGPYVRHGRTNATVPQDYDAAALTLEQAVAILEARKRGNGRKQTKPEGKTTKTGSRRQPTIMGASSDQSGRRGAVPVQRIRKSGKPPKRPAAARGATRKPTRSKSR